MRKTNQRIIIFIIIILSLIGGASCSAEEPPPEPVTLSFVVQSYETDYYEPLVEEFMLAHPEITVEITPIQGNNFQAYSEADVIGVNLFSFLQFQQQGAFLDLTPLIEQDNAFQLSDFYPGTVELFSSDNKVWAIPSGIDTFVMYYNKALFDQNGLSYPTSVWTWDDMFTNAVAIREGGGSNQFGYIVPEPYIDINAMILMSQHGGQLFDDLTNPTEVTFNHPMNVEAMQWYQDLFFEYNVAPKPDQASSAFGYGDQTNIRGVLQGDIGMWPGNFSDRNGVTWPVSWENLSWGIIALPGDLNAATSGFGTGYAVSAQAEKPEAAWKWVVFLSEKIPQVLIPARISLAESKEFQDRVGAESAAAALQSMENVSLISPDLLQYQEALGNFSQAILEIHNGTLSAQDALDQAQDQSQ